MLIFFLVVASIFLTILLFIILTKSTKLLFLLSVWVFSLGLSLVFESLLQQHFVNGLTYLTSLFKGEGNKYIRIGLVFLIENQLFVLVIITICFLLVNTVVGLIFYALVLSHRLPQNIFYNGFLNTFLKLLFSIPVIFSLIIFIASPILFFFQEDLKPISPNFFWQNALTDNVLKFSKQKYKPIEKGLVNNITVIFKSLADEQSEIQHENVKTVYSSLKDLLTPADFDKLKKVEIELEPSGTNEEDKLTIEDFVNSAEKFQENWNKIKTNEEFKKSIKRMIDEGFKDENIKSYLENLGLSLQNIQNALNS